VAIPLFLLVPILFDSIASDGIGADEVVSYLQGPTEESSFAQVFLSHPLDHVNPTAAAPPPVPVERNTPVDLSRVPYNRRFEETFEVDSAHHLVPHDVHYPHHPEYAELYFASAMDLHEKFLAHAQEAHQHDAHRKILALAQEEHPLVHDHIVQPSRPVTRKLHKIKAAPILAEPAQSFTLTHPVAHDSFIVPVETSRVRNAAPTRVVRRPTHSFTIDESELRNIVGESEKKEREEERAAGFLKVIVDDVESLASEGAEDWDQLHIE
ncbi:hypothetical protein PENTCL1PPCAC_29921, partial [Pristionchus entomophagus]